MNILIIYCHPSKKSYTFQVLQQLKTELANRNCNIEISDLYAMNFQSDMTEQEYEREALGKIEQSIPVDVQAEHRKIDKANCIIFLYPVWWSDCPAKLKGWFDRVLSSGYAYGKEPKMKVKHGIVICTAGYTNEYLHEIGIAQSMQTVMLDDRLGERFENKEMVVLGGTLEKEIVRRIHETKIQDIVKKIWNHLSLSKE